MQIVCKLYANNLTMYENIVSVELVHVSYIYINN